MANSIGGLTIHICSQVFARLKVNCTLRWNIHGLAGSRIAAYFWGLLAHRKATKATEFDAGASSQSVSHRSQQPVDGKLDIRAGQLMKLGCHFVDEVRAIHFDCETKESGNWSQVSLNGGQNRDMASPEV